MTSGKGMKKEKRTTSGEESVRMEKGESEKGLQLNPGWKTYTLESKGGRG